MWLKNQDLKAIKLSIHSAYCCIKATERGWFFIQYTVKFGTICSKALMWTQKATASQVINSL